jgi:hypothetical protein
MAMTGFACAIGAACTDQELRPSSPQERAQIEARVRACGFPMRDARWTRIEATEQWELGFETDEKAFARNSKLSECTEKIINQLVLPKHLDVMISYFAAEGPHQ